MDMKKVNSFESTLNSTTGVGAKLNNTGLGSTQNKSTVQGPSFMDTLNTIDKTQNGKDVTKTLQGQFDLKKEIPKLSNADSGIKFSNHAIERMQSRGISFKGDDMTRLNEAVDRAASKGSKDSLILMNDSALIVSVKNRTVVTVMDKTALKENVFTNIDSTIVM